MKVWVMQGLFNFFSAGPKYGLRKKKKENSES